MPLLKLDAGGMVEVDKAGYLWGDQMGDATIQASVRKVSGQNLSLILRRTGKSPKASNYAAWFNGGAGFGIGDNVDGKWTDLATVKAPKPYNDFFTMQFSAIGEQLILSVNGEEILRASDGKLKTGCVGIATRGGMSQFKDIQLRVIDPATLVPGFPCRAVGLAAILTR